jgi:flagellar assembly protein FliH
MEQMHAALDFFAEAAAEQGRLPLTANEPLAGDPPIGDGIRRKPRLVMRDPQQRADADVSHYELPNFVSDTHRGGIWSAPAPADEAARIVEEARQAAAAMLEQTRAVCEADREAARIAGYEAGFAAGQDAADEECAGLLHTAEQIGARVAQEREQLLAEAEPEIVELALAVAQKVVNATIELQPELVVDACRGAMRKAFSRETLVVRAHPDDLAMLREAGPRLAAELGGVQHLEFVEERRLQRGSLIVRTPAGEIDATFAGKAEKIAAALREVSGERVAERRVRKAA